MGGSGDNSITLNITQAQWDADENGIQSNILNFNKVTFSDGSFVTLGSATDDDILTSTVTADINTGDGDDTGTVTIANTIPTKNFETEAGNDNLSFGTYTSKSEISTGTGDDTITTTSRHLSVDLGEGDNTLVSAHELMGDVTAGSGNDSVTTTNASMGTVNLGDGNNTLTINTSTVSIISLGDGDDTVAINSNYVNTSINLGDGNNTLTGTLETSSASTKVSLTSGYGNDTVTLDSADSVDLGHGNNTATIGQLHQDLSVGNGNDTINVSSIHGDVTFNLGDGNNTLISSSAEEVIGGNDVDIVTLDKFQNIYNSAGTITLKDGNDKLTISTTLEKDINMGADNDFVNLETTSVSDIYSGLVVDGNDGHDAIKLNVTEAYYTTNKTSYNAKLNNFEQIELNDITLITTSLAEDTSNGSFAGIDASLNASTSQNISYFLVDINGDAISDTAFSIDSSTGIVSVNDTSLIDFDTSSEMLVYVKRVDDDGAEADTFQTFKLDIKFVNTDPVLALSDSDGDTSTINVLQEEATIIGNISDIDADIDFTSTTITSNNGVVSVDSSTGDITYTSDSSNSSDIVTLNVANTNDSTINTFTIPISVNLAPTDIILSFTSDTISGAPTIIGEISEVDTGTEGTITKVSTASLAWDTTVSSQESALASKGISVSFSPTLSSIHATRLGSYGLNTSVLSSADEAETSSYKVIDYAITFLESFIYIHENGDTKFIATTSYSHNSTYTVEIAADTGVVTYLEDGVVFYTSLITADLRVDYSFVATPYTPSRGVKNIEFDGETGLSICDNIGANAVITTMSASDTDSSSWTYTLVSGTGDDDNAAVSIGGTAGNEIILTANPDIDVQSSYSLRVQVTDDSGNTYQEVITFNVIDSSNSTPLVLDLDGDGVETISLSNGVSFDIDADGDKDLTGWASSDDGLLVRDINNDGIINDASELFGEETVKKDGTTAVDGFDALKQLDSNDDGLINSEDEAYNELQVWQDKNSDGITDDGELLSLEEAGVSEISLDATSSSEVDNGNIIGLESSYTYEEGNISEISDIWFAYEENNQEQTIDLSSENIIVNTEITNTTSSIINIELSYDSELFYSNEEILFEENKSEDTTLSAETKTTINEDNDISSYNIDPESSIKLIIDTSIDLGDI